MKLGRVLFLAVIAISSIGVAQVSPVEASKPPTCHGKTATKWLTEPGVLYFTEGDDVFVGSSGNDVFAPENFEDMAGTDVVCGRGGNDAIFAVVGPGSIADGGSGSDLVVATGGGLALGGSGDDVWVAALGPGSVADGGSGNESGQIDQGQLSSIFVLILNTYVPQFLADYQYFPEWGVWALDGATAKGGSGSDDVYGANADSVSGGSNSDRVTIEGTVDRVDCGSGVDSVTYVFGGASNSERRCERQGNS